MRNCISLILALAILLVGTAVPTYSLGETSDAQGKMLKVEADPTNGSIGYIYLTPGMLCQEGDYLEYDVYLMKDTSGIGGVDICYSTNLNCRDDAGFIDQNDISGHPAADISDYAYMQWYSRKLPITGNVIGTAGDIVIAFEGLTGKCRILLDNIRITRNGKTLGYAFKDGEDEYSFMGNTYADTNGAGITVSVVDANQLPVIIHQTDIDNVKNDLSSFSELAEVGEDEVKEVTSVIESYDHLTLDDRKNIDGSMAENLRRLLDQYNSVEYGDVDLNGSISSGDALLALQASVQKISLSKLQTKAADVDQKKGVTSADALLILQKSVGKIRIFPCVNESMLPGGLNLELSTGDSKVNVRVLNNVPSITYLATLSKNDNYVIKPVAINLPDSYSVDNGAYSGFDWKYAGYENFSDSETNTSGYKIKFTDDYLNVAYYMYVVTVGTLNGPFQFYGEIVNSSGKDFVILMDDIFDVSVTSEGTPTAWAFETEGQKASENGIIKTEMTPGASFTANCTTSQSGEGYIPIIYLDYASESGVYTALEWPSGNVNVRCISEKSVNLSVKLAGGFKTKITEDMVFQVPAVYLGVFDGDMDDGSNIFKRWFFDCKVPEVLRENPNEPLTQMDMQIGLETDRVGGVESVKWDNGWWAGSDQKLANGMGQN